MFRPVKVFDYAQTDGKPLPERVASPVANLTGSVENYEAFMGALRRSSPVPVEVSLCPPMWTAISAPNSEHHAAGGYERGADGIRRRP